MHIKNEKQAVDLMKILSNLSRLKILSIIFSAEKDICVNEISKMANISQSLASHQLAYLSSHLVVVGQKMGQTTCYIPAKNEVSKRVRTILKIVTTEG
jgi:predicted transcriptional regulator